MARAAKLVGDNVTADEIDNLMNLGAADLNDDGEIDREEFAGVMDSSEVGKGWRFSQRHFAVYILQSKHVQSMKASMFLVTNLTPPESR